MAYPTTTVFNPKATTYAGLQPIATTSTTQNHPIGTVVKGTDFGTGALGEGEYIYLKGIGSTIAGSLVCYDPKANTTVLVVDDGATSIGPAAVAMSANVASQYGWYCISGVVPVDSGSNTVLTNAAVYFSGTGQIDDAVVAGDLVTGMFTVSGNSSGFTYCLLQRPYIYQAVQS